MNALHREVPADSPEYMRAVRLGVGVSVGDGAI
jgi:hypothetical protein